MRLKGLARQKRTARKKREKKKSNAFTCVHGICLYVRQNRALACVCVYVTCVKRVRVCFFFAQNDLINLRNDTNRSQFPDVNVLMTILPSAKAT